MDANSRKRQAYLKRLKGMIGKEVEVIMDRPLGSHHPDYPDMVYPVNYGYVSSFLAPDGEYQDAYLLGVDFPVHSYWGIVIGVIERSDDDEGKLVVAPKGISFSNEEILDHVHFQEKYFKSSLIR